jgi:lipid II:glycine glycyltransferase (peptidoglycan interpeptide bridge formation enzyme)
MRWAKRAGYRYFDFEGIEPTAAGDGSTNTDGVSTFKLGFGGDVVCASPAYQQIHPPALRLGYRWLFPYVVNSAPARWVVNTIRTR